jgi:hypothetical protein
MWKMRACEMINEKLELVKGLLECFEPVKESYGRCELVK